MEIIFSPSKVEVKTFLHIKVVSDFTMYQKYKEHLAICCTALFHPSGVVTLSRYSQQTADWNLVTQRVCMLPS